MFRDRPLDDASIEALLADPTSDEALGPLVQALRLSARAPAPAPSPMLTEALARGFFPDDKGDLPVTAASNVHGPRLQASGLPKRRKKMAVPQFVAAMSLAGKMTLGAGVAAAATTGAGAAGVLPEPAQTAVAGAVAAATPFTLPSQASGAAGSVPSTPAEGAAGERPAGRALSTADPSGRAGGVDVTATQPENEPEVATLPEERATPPGDARADEIPQSQPGLGSTVRDEARAGEVDGAEVSERARQQRPATPAAPAGSVPPGAADRRPTEPAAAGSSAGGHAAVPPPSAPPAGDTQTAVAGSPGPSRAGDPAAPPAASAPPAGAPPASVPPASAPPIEPPAADGGTGRGGRP